MISLSQGRLQDRRPISIIDIGSNSIRLVVYEGVVRSPTVLFNEKMLAGLGRGLVTTGKLDLRRVARSMDEFKRFRALSEQAGAESFYVIATAAAREAENGPDFIRRAEEILGTQIRVLTGREEAYYSALGVISGLPPGGRHCRRPRRRQPGACRCRRRNHRRRHHASAGRPAPAGHVEEFADRSRQDRARRTGARQAAQGRRGPGLLCRRRHLAKPRATAHERHGLPAERHAPLRTRHRGIAAVPAAGGARRHREDEGHRRRVQGAPCAAALWRRRAAGDHRGDAAVEDRRVGAWACARVSCSRCCHRRRSAPIR